MNDIEKKQEIKRYYDDRYSERNRLRRTPHDYKIYLDYLGIDTNSEGKLLDIACGSGLLLKNAENSSLSTFGTDISCTGLSLARRLTARSHLLVNSGEQICFKSKTFDFVFCLGSLEHFLDIPRGLSEMTRVAKPNAKLCIIVPNTIHYRPDAKSRWGFKKIVGTKQQEMLERLHTYDEWKSILERSGLRVRKHYKDTFFIKKRSILKNVLFYLWLRFLPLRYAYQFIFVCEHINRR